MPSTTKAAGLSATEKRTRKTICGAFLGLLETSHYSTMKIKEVIGVSGVSKSTFYKYFKDKEDLRLAVVKDFAGLCAELYKNIQKSKGQDRVYDLISSFASSNKPIFWVISKLADGQFPFGDILWEGFLEALVENPTFRERADGLAFFYFIITILKDTRTCTKAVIDEYSQTSLKRTATRS